MDNSIETNSPGTPEHSNEDEDENEYIKIKSNLNFSNKIQQNRRKSIRKEEQISPIIKDRLSL